MTISTNCRGKVFLNGMATIAILASVLWSGALSGGNPALGGEAKRGIPRPLAHHPGNVFLEGDFGPAGQAVLSIRFVTGK